MLNQIGQILAVHLITSLIAALKRVEGVDTLKLSTQDLLAGESGTHKHIVASLSSYIQIY